MLRRYATMFILALCTALAACDPEVIEEPVGYGDYHVVNQTSVAVTVEAFELFGDNQPVALLVDTVEPDATEHIYTFVEGSGGHVMPSNAFGGFRITATVDSQPLVIYDEVDNERWPTVGSSPDGHQILEFTVTEDDITQAQQ